MLRQIGTNEFPKVYKIMDDSFPFDEHRPYDEQKALMNRPNYRIFVRPDGDSDEICAFIAAWEFDEFVFIEHFAVDKDFRSGGIGSLVLAEFVKMMSSRVLLEVELPEDDKSRRRIEFYRRNGFYLNDYPYIQPPVSKDRKALPLMIMTTGGGISEAEFECFRDKLFKFVYESVN